MKSSKTWTLQEIDDAVLRMAMAMSDEEVVHGYSHGMSCRLFFSYQDQEQRFSWVFSVQDGTATTPAKTEKKQEVR